MTSVFNSELAKKIVRLALEEDLSSGDITTELTVPSHRRGRAEILAKESMVACGLPIVEVILREAGGTDHKVQYLVSEGSRVKKGAVLARIAGSLNLLLATERTILNFVQRTSGIATGVRKITEKVTGITVLDTRKTTPGLRVLEKYAVRVGGGKNHRFSLGDMILVKNNHVDANGSSMKKTLAALSAKKSPYMQVEVEVRTIQELAEALEFHPTVVMLDNMNDAEIKRSLALIKVRQATCLVEVSGGVSLERLTKLKKLGINLVSMGTLTTRATNVDISMRIS